jgi:hypothetical protein
VAFSGEYADLAGAPVLAPVATSGSYNDLTDKPSGAVVITEVVVDPSSPNLGDAWLFKTLNVAEGEFTGMFGAMPFTQETDSYSFQLSIQTSEGVKRLSMT